MVFLGLFRIDIYCQNCGKDITNEGGFVSDDGKIFCHINRSCLDEVINYNELSIEYETAREVQKDIKYGRLIHYTQLEKKKLR